MKKNYLPLFLMIMLLVSGCAVEEGEQTVTIEKRYSLTIPSFLSESNGLSEEASLQYQNMFQEFYVVVIDEPKSALQTVLTDYELTDTYENNLDGYTELVLKNLYDGLENPLPSKVIEANVNGLPARLTTMDGIVDEIPIYYTYGFYEGKDMYYQVIAWTLSERQNKHRDKMDAILQTFKELKTYRKKPAVK